MPYYLLHAGTALQKMSVAGGLTTLTLPTGASIVATRTGRFATLNEVTAFVNAGNRNLLIDGTTVRVMSILQPSSVPTVGLGAAGVLTGNYYYQVSYAEYDGTTLVSESPLSGATALVAPSSQKVELTAIPTSPAGYGVTHRRIYRTVAGGTAYFFVANIADNTTTTYTDNTADASISGTAVATDLGNPPGTTAADRLELIIAYKNRLWAASTGEVDRVYYSGLDRWFAWASTQYFSLQPTGQDVEGITAFLPRRDELGMAKRRAIWKLVGSTTSDFRVINVSTGVGVIAPETVVTIADLCYFLAEDGVWRWGANGLEKLSSMVDAWFTRDDTFNRTAFARAFAKYNVLDDAYELHLAAIGSEDIDRWISLDLKTGKWLGPHKTAVCTPTAAGAVEDSSGLLYPVIGSSAGYLYRQGADQASDGSATAIDFTVDTPTYTMNAPAQTKYWGELVMYTKPEAAGTLTVTPYLGEVGASAGTNKSHDLTTGRQRLSRLGVGVALKLRFQQATAAQDCQLYGFAVRPVHLVGDR